VAFRYCSYDVPFWARPNTQAQRWNLPREDCTQYWALTPDGAWAEHIRANDIETETELDEIRIPIWVCRLSCMDLIDLRQAEVRDRYELTAADLTSPDWGACQRAATSMRTEGARGLLAPSAALANATNVTLFGPRRQIAFDRRPALASAVPATVVAIGRPPRKLLERVIRRTSLDRLFE
jgi:RES domain-containing protein